MPIDDALRSRVAAVSDQLSRWRLPEDRHDRVREAAHRVSTALAAGDADAVREAIDDLEILGPRRGVPLDDPPAIPLPPDIEIVNAPPSPTTDPDA